LNERPISVISPGENPPPKIVCGVTFSAPAMLVTVEGISRKESLNPQ
jgi:hypothetical protein